MNHKITIALIALILVSTVSVVYYLNLPITTESVIDMGDGIYCEDSDGGYKPFREGWARLTIPDIDYTDDKQYDYCVDEGTLAEYTCSSSSGVNLQTYDCEGGCKNGACVECEENDYKKCYNDDVYWFDSCDNRGSRAENCNMGCEDNQCLDNQYECTSVFDCSYKSVTEFYCDGDNYMEQLSETDCINYECTMVDSGTNLLSECEFGCGLTDGLYGCLSEEDNKIDVTLIVILIITLLIICIGIILLWRFLL